MMPGTGCRHAGCLPKSLPSTITRTSAMSSCRRTDCGSRPGPAHLGFPRAVSTRGRGAGDGRREVNKSETALWWARVRCGRPQLVEAGGPFPAGMARLAEPGVTGVWLLPVLPDGARPGMTDELGIPPVAVDQPNDTARVLAACLRCCSPELSAPVWPGAPASKDHLRIGFQGDHRPRRDHVQQGRCRRDPATGRRRVAAVGRAQPGRSTGAAGRVLEPGGAEHPA